MKRANSRAPSQRRQPRATEEQRNKNYFFPI
jgi:hypothetical protein